METLFNDTLNLQVLEDKCKKCKLHNKCKRKRKIGNSKNPKLIFILPEIDTEDELNFEVPDRVRIGTVANLWRSIQPAFKDKNSNLTPNDVLFMFLIPHKIEFPQNARIPKHKKDVYKQSIAEQCKEHLFYELYNLPEDAILIPVGFLPTQILLNAKNVFNLSGKEKERKIINPLNKRESKKFRVIPLIHPNSIAISLKNRQVFVKSLNYILYLLSGKKSIELQYKIIRPDKVESFVNSTLKLNPPYIVFDTETSALTHKDRKIIGVSIKIPNVKTVYYIPLHSNNYIDEETGEQISITEYEKSIIKQQLRRLLTSIPFIGHNIKFDIVACQLEGILGEDDYELLADTYVMAHIKYNQSLGGLGLKHLARLFFDVYDDWDKPLEDEKSKIAKIKKIPKRQVSYADINTNLVGKYACYDVHYTYLLYHKLNKELTSQEKELHKQILNEIKAVATWEYHGVKIDENNFTKLKEYTIEKHSKAKFLMQNLSKIKEHFGDKFNPNSTKQLQKVIEIYNLPVLAKTDTGQPKFDKNVVEQYLKLDSISDEAKIFIQAYAEYKYYEKAISSYINPIPEQTDNNGIFRTDFKICGTRSGRLSSYFHTLPSKSEYGKNFKRLITSKSDDFMILSSDISQAEPRTMASLSGDKKLQEVYNQGKDIYKYIASIVYHMDYNKVPKDIRNKMKSLVLALMYGMSPKTFAEKSGITVEEAQQIFDRFFTEFKDVYKFIQQRHKEVMSKGGITTPFGRFITIDDKEIYERKKKAQNYIIQSTASELCLFQFSDITHHLIKSNMKSRVVASVHDSIVIDTHIPEIFQVINIMRFKLEKIIQWKYKFIRVPFKIDIQLGISWGNSVELTNIINNGYEVVGYKEDIEKLMDRLSDYGWKYEVVNEYEVELPENSLITIPIEGIYRLYKS